jgi:hypothetical protein
MTLIIATISLASLWQQVISQGPTWIGLLITLLPSLIVAATPFPKVDGFLKGALRVVNVFSLLVHKDSPGTLKLPFVNSDAPVPVKGKSAGGFARLELLVAIGLLGLSCAWFQKQGAAQALDCAKHQVATAVQGAIVGALTGGASNSLTWETELATNSLDDVICTLTAWVSDIGQKAGTSSLSSAQVEGLQRAQSWLKGHGVTSLPTNGT